MGLVIRRSGKLGEHLFPRRTKINSATCLWLGFRGGCRRSIASHSGPKDGALLLDEDGYQWTRKVQGGRKDDTDCDLVSKGVVRSSQSTYDCGRSSC